MGYSGNGICFSVRKSRTQILGLQIILWVWGNCLIILPHNWPLWKMNGMVLIFQDCYENSVRKHSIPGMWKALNQCSFFFLIHILSLSLDKESGIMKLFTCVFPLPFFNMVKGLWSRHLSGVVLCVWCRRNVNRKNIQEIRLVYKKGLCSQTKTLEVTLLACKKIGLNSLNHLFSISVSTEDSDPGDLLRREGGPACH